MELFYNPERMSETEIKETFVAYQWLVDEIISILKRQPKGAGVQHVVIVAPRGMGKTTMLLMLRFTVLSQGLSKRWQPVLFPEESYSVYDLADLWVEVIDHVASETGDVALHEEIKKLKYSHPDSSDLEAVALASIKDWRDKNKKRLLLLIDNFDMILEQIGNEKDNASLRDVLMNDGTMMLVGGSTTFFKEARAYDQPLYNLFKIYNLNGLNSEQVEDLLRRRAKMDGLENFEEILRANRSRLRVLEYFTGGNPRLVLMLYRVLTHSDISEVRRGLEKLLDEVTPYYKAKIETLPAQQRKILDQIARISSQTRQGLTPTEIASATRLSVNQASAQLKRLADVGYVRAANIRGRSSYYTLSEPLYAIWHQMRFGRDVRTRMNWLIAFLKGWYDAKELGVESQRLQDVFRQYLTAGRDKEARDALEHRRYLMEAVEDRSLRAHTLEGIVIGYLELRDVDTLKHEILRDVDVTTLSAETRQRLASAGVLDKDFVRRQRAEETSTEPNAAQIQTSIEHIQAVYKEGRSREATKLLGELETQFSDPSQRLFMRALVLLSWQDYQAALVALDELLEKEPRFAVGWRLKGVGLKQTAKLDDAVLAFEQSLKLDVSTETLSLLAETLEELRSWQEALTNFEKILQIQPEFVSAILGQARVLLVMNRIDEALLVVKRAISLEPDNPNAWFTQGTLLVANGNDNEALESLKRATTLDSTVDVYFFLNARILRSLNRDHEALESLNRALELNPSYPDAYFLRANLLVNNDFAGSMADYKRAFDSKSDPVHRAFVESFNGKQLKTVLALIDQTPEQIKANWQELMFAAEVEGGKSKWLDELTQTLNIIARGGHWSLARELISLSELEEEMYPLARALDYLITGDSSIVEKLSPEVQKIVEEIVSTLKNSSTNADKTSSGIRKRSVGKRKK